MLTKYEKAKQKALITAKEVPAEKLCNNCRVLKPLKDFDKRCSSTFGIDTLCKTCKKKKEKEYYHSHQSAKDKRRDYALRNKYGISLEDYNLLLKNQNYCCAICQLHLDKSTPTLVGHVDHCHKTNTIRGILCGQCNVGLGHFYENEDSLLNAVQYLRKYK